MLNVQEFLFKIEEDENIKESFKKFLLSKYSIYNYNFWKKLNLLNNLNLNKDQIKKEMNELRNLHLLDESEEEVKKKKKFKKYNEIYQFPSPKKNKLNTTKTNYHSFCFLHKRRFKFLIVLL